MSKEWKAPDKVTQKMTRDGAVAENLTTGETTSISERPQEENYSQAPTAAAEKAVDRIGAEVERQAAKGAGKKALDAAQLKTHTSRLQFYRFFRIGRAERLCAGKPFLSGGAERNVFALFDFISHFLQAAQQFVKIFHSGNEVIYRRFQLGFIACTLLFGGIFRIAFPSVLSRHDDG